MTGNKNAWRAPLAGLASLAMIATMGVAASTANAAPTPIPTDDPNKPNITFNSNEHGWFAGTASAKASTYTHKDVVNKGDNLDWSLATTALTSDSNWTFTGWYTSPEYGAAKFDFTQRLTSDVTVYAHWSTKPATVNFNDGSYAQKNTNDPQVNENSGNVQVTIAPGDVLASWQLPADTPADGHLIDGYSTNGSSADFDATKPVSGNVNLNPVLFNGKVVTVKWDKSIVKGQTTSAYFTGWPADVDVKAGSSLTDPEAHYGIPSGAISRKVVTKWQYNAADPSATSGRTTVWDFANNKVPSNVDSLSLVATEAKPAQVVVFDAQGGNPATTTVYVVKGTALAASKVPAAPYRYGYEFKGWEAATDAGGNTLKHDNGVVEAGVNTVSPVDADVTYYAEWVQTEKQQKVITFDYNYDGAPAAVEKTYDVNAFVKELPAAPSRDGYKFIGWFDQADGDGQQLTENTWIGSTVARTFYAVWQKNEAKSNAYQLWLAWGYPVADHKAQGNRGNVSTGFTEKSFGEYRKTVQDIFENLSGKQQQALNNASDAQVATYFKDDAAAGEVLAKLQAAQAKLEFNADKAIKVYRLYDAANTTKHLYTTSKSEYQTLLIKGWRDETKTAQGRFDLAPYADYTTDKDGNVTFTGDTKAAIESGFIKPIYRVYQKFTPDGSYVNRHFYTTDKAEYDGLLAKGWRNEGLFGLSRNFGGSKVYRTYSASRYEHLYTSSKAEADKSVSNYGYRWDDKTVAFNSAD